MTLADEIMSALTIPSIRGRLVELEEPPFRLDFNGELSRDELRMAAQFTFDGPASWEDE